MGGVRQRRLDRRKRRGNHSWLRPHSVHVEGIETLFGRFVTMEWHSPLHPGHCGSPHSPEPANLAGKRFEASRKTAKTWGTGHLSCDKKLFATNKCIASLRRFPSDAQSHPAHKYGRIPPDHPSLKSEGYIRYPGCDACAFSYLSQFVADLQLAIRGNNKTSDCPASMIFTLASLASTVITVNTVTLHVTNV